MLRGIAVAAVLVTVAAPARAQARADTARYRLDSLQVAVTRAAVHPGRLPVALTRVGRAQIQDARPLLGLDEALAAVPGLVINNRYNPSVGSRIVMRGLGARAAFGVRGLRVLVDGVPLTMPDGQTNLNNLDLGSAGAIHILRGPASALFGNAAGGVIAIETEPAPGPFSAEARFGAGDQDAGSLTQLTRLQLKAGQMVGRAGYIASASHLDAAGFRDHSRTRQSVFNGRFTFDATSATELSLVLNAVDMPVAESPGALPIDSARLRPRMAWPNNARTRSGEAMRQVQAAVRVRHAFTRGSTDLTIYGIRRTLENPLPFGVIDLERSAGGVRALYELPLGAGGAVIAGFDTEAQRDDRLEFANEAGAAVGEARRDQQDRVTNFGPFAQAHVAAGAFGVTAGARYDAVHFETVDRRGVEPDESGSRTLHAPSVMLGVIYATRLGTVFGNIATSFQTPTTTELINAPPAAGQPCCPTGFNRGLEPQRALSTEVGLRNAAPDWQYEVVAYRMRVTDALVPFQVPDAEGREFFRNAGRTRHQGVEISA
ncbi:MAG: TonB-dependent receptor, partial [Gemmatimonadota bacterium]